MRKITLFNNLSLCFGTASTVCCIVSRSISKNPLELMHMIESRNIIPSLWILNLFSLIWYFLIGLALGAIIQASSEQYNLGPSILSAYRGGLFFTICFFLSLIWYPIFFSCEHLILSVLISFLALISSIICAANWCTVTPRSGAAIMTSFSIWSFYIMFISLFVAVQN